MLTFGTRLLVLLLILLFLLCRPSFRSLLVLLLFLGLLPRLLFSFFLALLDFLDFLDFFFLRSEDDELELESEELSGSEEASASTSFSRSDVLTAPSWFAVSLRSSFNSSLPTIDFKRPSTLVFMDPPSFLVSVSRRAM